MPEKATLSPPQGKDVSPPEVITMAPSGDAIMVVGKAKRKMRVHSVILSAASPVFKAMLGPSYSEGAGLSTVNPKEIMLPEDNEDALQTIFYAIHFQSDAIGGQLSPDLVLQVAIAANKYDFINALKYPLQVWFSDGTIPDAQKLWKLVFAAFWIQSEEYFKSTTKMLLTCYGEPFLRLGCIDQMPPDAGGRFFGMMEQKRSELRMDLLSRIVDIGRSVASTYKCINSPHNCKYGKECQTFFWEQVWCGTPQNTTGLHPSRLARISLDEAVAAVRSACATKPSESGGCKYSVYHVKPTSFEAAASVTLGSFTQLLEGLCLTCVRTGEEHKTHDPAVAKNTVFQDEEGMRRG
ncbi:hypothetical protein B0T25DRAFT_535692 [Lasiosphaeria hispida]|uniref:BTB domain-containing protein n=1 Tax=Lasiosphaeria hispida TaxID=260671 RepID=A0AAJ0HS53_9PEZI|nr:hypothetical protein B0T25DRAFT_535692 [Lasiosphaeria hispida]